MSVLPNLSPCSLRLWPATIFNSLARLAKSPNGFRTLDRLAMGSATTFDPVGLPPSHFFGLLVVLVAMAVGT
jgi:hypothetical protein